MDRWTDIPVEPNKTTTMAFARAVEMAIRELREAVEEIERRLEDD